MKESIKWQYTLPIGALLLIVGYVMNSTLGVMLSLLGLILFASGLAESIKTYKAKPSEEKKQTKARKPYKYLLYGLLIFIALSIVLGMFIES